LSSIGALNLGFQALIDLLDKRGVISAADIAEIRAEALSMAREVEDSGSTVTQIVGARAADAVKLLFLPFEAGLESRGIEIPEPTERPDRGQTS
jgi:hypothetical protein